MRPDYITLSIEEKYTPEQKQDIAGQLATAVADLDLIYSDKKVSDAAFNERIKAKEAEMSEFARRYNKGCTMRDVECSIRYNIPSLGKKSFFRKDTEQLVETREMTPEDKQENISFPPPADKKPKKPAEPTIEERTAEITFRYFQDVAATIWTLPESERQQAIKDMAEKLAQRLLEQGEVANRKGKLEKIKNLKDAQKLAESWLTGCVLKQGEDKTGPEASAD